MSLTNTETAAFTSVPESIRKRWETKSVQPDTLTQCAKTSSHRKSMLESIEIKMDFSSGCEFYSTVCTNADDKNQNAIVTWRENRELWSSIEEAVAAAVDEYVEHVRSAASKERSRSCSLPLVSSTVITPRGTSQIGKVGYSAPSMHPAPESLFPRMNELSPNDSASAVVFNMSDIQSIIQREIKAQKHRKTRIVKDGKSKGSKSMSLLSYAAGKR